jgi:penicillin amidase
MKILRTVLLVLLVIIAVLALGGVILFNRVTRGPLPLTEGQVTIRPQTVEVAAQTISLPGLSAQVEILRDNFGIPHIYASSTYDLFFAQGYAQAQDRWWQMEFSRAIGDGRIQELVGQNNTVMGQDVFIRTVGWRKAAERDVSGYSPEALAVLQAFADGVNAYILNRSPGDLALEYTLLGLTGVSIPIRPWTPADSIVWSKVMAWDLSGNRDTELFRSDLIAKVGPEMAASFAPDWPFGSKPTIVWPEDLPLSDASLTTSANTAGVIGVSDVLAGNITAADPLFRRDASLGSNNWVISGALTTTGKPLLANDPHLGIQMPSIWYEIGLHCQPVSDACPFEVTGFALPATPGVIIGHNSRIAWGVTNVGPDTQDLYLLKINPDNPLQYEWNGGWRDMTVRDEVIRFGDTAETITIQVRETHLGPIINDNRLDDSGQPTGFNNQDPMAFKWTATAEPGTILEAVLRLNRAGTWEEFREAARLWDVPSQNIIYADIDGNIGYQTPGRIPIRAAGHTGLLPVDGTTDQYEWKGYIPFDDLPRILNPERGYISTANQAVVPLEYYDQLREKLAAQFGADSNYVISYEWAYGYRGQRINQLIESTSPHSIQTIQAIQGDNKIISAEELRPYIESLNMGDARYNELRDWMLNWDYQMRMDSQQAGLYAYFWQQLTANTFDDQLGDVGQAGQGDQIMWAVYQLVQSPDNPWWDDAATAGTTETRDDILARSFREAVDQITAEQGENRENWAWGKLHTATFVSNPLGQSGIDLIENIVNRGPYETSGGSDIVNATGWYYPDTGFTVRSLPSMRMIVDLSDMSNSQTMHTTGQSGHAYSPHYADMINLWRSIQYHPMLWTRQQVDTAAADRLILVPGS